MLKILQQENFYWVAFFSTIVLRWIAFYSLKNVNSRNILSYFCMKLINFKVLLILSMIFVDQVDFSFWVASGVWYEHLLFKVEDIFVSTQYLTLKYHMSM